MARGCALSTDLHFSCLLITLSRHLSPVCTSLFVHCGPADLHIRLSGGYIVTSFSVHFILWFFCKAHDLFSCWVLCIHLLLHDLIIKSKVLHQILMQILFPSRY